MPVVSSEPPILRIMGSLYKIYRILLISEILSSIPVFILLNFITAPYGKHSSGRWGLKVNERIAWFFMEVPAFLVFLYIFLKNRENSNLTTLTFFILWEVHYFYRSFIYPFLLRGARKNFPVILIITGFLFNMVNAFINSYFLFFLSSKYSNRWIISIQFITGFLLFVTGFVLHITSDRLIRNLRKSGEKGYKIPYGGLFNKVSNPNYLGEIIEWMGWAVMTLSLSGLAFALFTVANLLPRAIANHKWYINNFPDYPGERKIIIPYIF